MNRDAELRRKIIEKSLELFRTRGVKASTIKLIASAAGCTNAAIYYYFERGKDQILEEAILDILSKKIRTFEQLSTDMSFQVFFRQIGELASRDFQEVTNNVSWLVTEFPSLPKKLQKKLQKYLLKGHEILASALSHYLDVPAEASGLAWMLFCT